MKQSLLKFTLLALTLLMNGVMLRAEKYVIYPIPHSISMQSGTLSLTEKVNVICESTIDQATQKRLASILSAHQMEAIYEGHEAGNLTVRLGTVYSDEQTEQHATTVLGLEISRIMVSGKYDRHALSISEHGITIMGEHTNAVFCGLASLEQILEQSTEGTIGYTTIYDRADQQNRGLVEGYYGYPYSVEVKKDLMRYMMRHKMNTYMYGAKSDPYHSQMWKDPYPTSISAQQEKNGWLSQDMVKELSQVSEETKVNFIWAIHPGNDFLGSNTVIDDIMSKFELMHNLGVRHFGVFVDDVSIPSSDADMKKNADRLTALQQAIEEKWNTDGAEAKDTVRPLHFVPQIYCNSFANSVDQRQRFMSALNKVPDYITVYSTGQGVWSVPNNDHTVTIMNEFGRPMSWWWNYPCNDNADGQIYPMDMYSNFVDMRAVGSNERLPSLLNNCQGIVANPMQQGEVAKTSLFSIADYTWNNAGFKNLESWEASFKTIIKDEQVRQAYHDITYYLRWNEPQSMQTLINNYKTSLENGTPNSAALISAIQKIKTDCEMVLTMKDSQIQSDRLLYTDIAPWVHTLHTYSVVIEKMLQILDNQTDGHQQNWLAVKEVSDSLVALETSTLYTAYALEGMGNSISVSSQQAQLSRLYIYPFISYLRDKAITPYFYDASEITSPTVISNSPLLNATLTVRENTVELTMPNSNLDVNKYVGIVLPEPILLDKLTITENLLPFFRYSTNGKEWKTISNLNDTPHEHVGYAILINENTQGVKDFAIPEGSFSFSMAGQAQVENVTIPEGNIWEGHTGALMVDGNYNTFTCLNRNQQTGDLYTLDLGSETILHDVRLCMGTTNGDYPHTAWIQYSADGSNWASLKVKGAETGAWTINLEQNVVYSDEMVYCDFDGAGRSARYVRLRLTTANTSKWMRLYEIEVNKQYALNSTLTECHDANNQKIEALTDNNAQTGILTSTTSPITYSIHRHYDVDNVTFYTLPSNVQPTISVTTDGEQWTPLCTLSEACQEVELSAYPKAQALRIEWQGSEIPSIFEISTKYNTKSTSLPDEDTDLAMEFALLKAKALHALDSCGQGDKLITSNSQFSSPYTESTQGSLNNLLDGNQATFWHSAWSAGSVQDGVHYLEIALPEGTEGDVIMHMGRRSDTDGHHLIEAQILGVVSGSGTSATTEIVANLMLPYKDQYETVKTSFYLPKAYPSIRLLEQKTSGSHQGGSAGFFHLGELQLYSTINYYIIKGAQAEAENLMKAAMPLPSEATQEDLENLKKAYDEFMYRVFNITPSNIGDVLDNNIEKYHRFYDLSGRKIKHPSKNGIYIINGKKRCY